MTDPASGKRGEGDSFFQRMKGWAIPGGGGLVAGVVHELVADKITNTSWGQLLATALLIAFGGGLGAAVLMVIVVGAARTRRALRGRAAERTEPEPDPETAIEELQPREPPIEPQRWAPPGVLFGREAEVGKAVSRVLEDGVVAVVGPRDVGTSAVAEHVVQALIDEHGGEVAYTYRFDLRSRSTSEPFDAIATAGRIVPAFYVGEPTDDTGNVLTRAANQLIDKVAKQGAILFLDNVSTAEQVSWLVEEWPSGGSPWLVIAGEDGVGEAAAGRRVDVRELELVHLRDMWDHELNEPEPGIRQRILAKLDGSRRDADPVDELLAACLGRPRGVKAFTEEIRSASTLTVENLVHAIRAEGRADGPLERVWGAILHHIWDSLGAGARELLEALAVLPVTGLNRAGIKAVLDSGEEALASLDELRKRNLLQEQNERFRLPAEIRRPIVATMEEQRLDELALRVIPRLVGYAARYTAHWVARLADEPVKARAWFLDSMPTLRALFGKDLYRHDGVLERVLDDLCVIADALETWYVREQQSRGLIEVNRAMSAFVRRLGRADLAALAGIRLATAHRLAGRTGDARSQLDAARQDIDDVRDRHVRSQLNSRLQADAALLALASAVPGDCGNDADRGNERQLRNASRELRKRRRRDRVAARSPEILVDLGAVWLGRSRPSKAMGYLRKAERRAKAAGDLGCRAHAVELQGIALSQQDGRLLEAVRRWQQACAWYERIEENRGLARCLQHLGSAAVVHPQVAGWLRDGRWRALPAAQAMAVATERLKQAKSLRTGQPDTSLVDHYLDQARQGATG